MTRSEFLDYVDTWEELKVFCDNEGCDYLEDVYDESGMDYEIERYIDEVGGRYNWRDLKYCLNSIPEGYQYYRKNDPLDWDYLDDNDFDSYKDDVFNWAEDRDVFEDDEQIDELDSNEPKEDEDPLDRPIESEDFSFDELFGLCAQELDSIETENAQEKAREYAEFENFVKCG